MKKHRLGSKALVAAQDAQKDKMLADIAVWFEQWKRAEIDTHSVKGYIRTKHEAEGWNWWKPCKIEKEKPPIRCLICGKPCGTEGFMPIIRDDYRRYMLVYRLCHRHR